jgi:hypothetical protein
MEKDSKSEAPTVPPSHFVLWRAGNLGKIKHLFHTPARRDSASGFARGYAETSR